MADDATKKKRIGAFARNVRGLREAGTVQLIGMVIFVLFSIFIARYSWALPGGQEPTAITSDAERALYDTRAYLAADLVEQDDRIVLVVFDDQSLINLEKRSPLPR